MAEKNVKKNIKTIKISGLTGNINLKDISVYKAGTLKISSKVLKNAVNKKVKYIVLLFKDYKVKLTVKELSKLIENDKVLKFQFKKDLINKKIKLSILGKKSKIVKILKVK